MAEVLESPANKAKKTLILKQIWDKSNEELFNDVDAHYEAIKEIDKQNTINEKALNQHIRDLSYSLEELWKRGQLPYNQHDVCSEMCKKLIGCTKNIRILVARQLDSRFKRKWTPPVINDSNVTAVTFPDSSNKDAQSSILLEGAKRDIMILKNNLENLNPSDVQELHDLLSNAKNKVDKHCKENNIQTVEYDSAESDMDRRRKEAKGDPISCPTPDGIEQQEIKTDNKTSEEILASLRTKTAKSIFEYGMSWINVALVADNYPPILEGDDEKLASAFQSSKDFLECATDIKVKRDNAQWAEICDKYFEVSKHNAASNDSLKVFGVSCHNCGSRMKPIDKKRDFYRLHWRCPNYYRTESQFNKCKLDKPLDRDVSKERITEVHKHIMRWAIDEWNTRPDLYAFIYWFRNYKQPFHTEHTKKLEWKFQRRGV